MLLWNHLPELRLEFLGAGIAHTFVLLGNDDIDAVGSVANVIVNPVEFLSKLIRRETHGPQHAEASGLDTERPAFRMPVEHRCGFQRSRPLIPA